jgi:hypothetical protein
VLFLAILAALIGYPALYAGLKGDSAMSNGVPLYKAPWSVYLAPFNSAYKTQTATPADQTAAENAALAVDSGGTSGTQGDPGPAPGSSAGSTTGPVGPGGTEAMSAVPVDPATTAPPSSGTTVNPPKKKA